MCGPAGVHFLSRMKHFRKVSGTGPEFFQKYSWHKIPWNHLSGKLWETRKVYGNSQSIEKYTPCVSQIKAAVIIKTTTAVFRIDHVHCSQKDKTSMESNNIYWSAKRNFIQKICLHFLSKIVSGFGSSRERFAAFHHRHHLQGFLIKCFIWNST